MAATTGREESSMGAPYRIVHDWSVPADRDAPLLIDGDGAPVAWGTYESVCAALNAAHAAGAAEERANLDSQLSAERARAEAAERRLVEARRALADIASDGGQSGGCLSERAEKALDALRPASAKPSAAEERLTGETLAGAWSKYAEFFGEPPHGTVKQMSALLELAGIRQQAASAKPAAPEGKGESNG
jgi:hypothetical protein